MNKLSEDEIIKELKILIGLEEFNKLSYKENKAIKSLLDLYQKEKEKNKNLLQLLNKSGIDTINLVNDVNNNYISKDKIREKIKELEENVKEFEEYWSKDPRKFKRTKSIDYYKLEALQKLLEENNGK